MPASRAHDLPLPLPLLAVGGSFAVIRFLNLVLWF
jgi:hypothetical protein